MTTSRESTLKKWNAKWRSHLEENRLAVLMEDDDVQMALKVAAIESIEISSDGIFVDFRIAGSIGKMEFYRHQDFWLNRFGIPLKSSGDKKRAVFHKRREAFFNVLMDFDWVAFESEFSKSK